MIIIDPDKVTDVIFQNPGTEWTDVSAGFRVGTPLFVGGGELGEIAPWYSFKNADGDWVSGPLWNIRAVRESD